MRPSRETFRPSWVCDCVRGGERARRDAVYEVSGKSAVPRALSIQVQDEGQSVNQIPTSDQDSCAEDQDPTAARGAAASRERDGPGGRPLELRMPLRLFRA